MILSFAMSSIQQTITRPEAALWGVGCTHVISTSTHGMKMKLISGMKMTSSVYL